LAENDAGEVVVRGWFAAPSGEIVVAGLATFGFSADDDLVTAFVEPDVAYDDVVHSFYTTATPLIAWALDGLEAIHASAVRHPLGVIAFCGPTESGKTTLAHALAARGHERFAEDAVAFRVDGNGALAIALPFTVNLREPTREHFGASSLPSPADVHVATSAESPFTAVFLLDPGDESGETPTIEQLAPAEAMLALLPNAHRFKNQPAARERRMLEAYLALVDEVAIYRLTYSQAFEQLETVLSRVEAAVAA
jgi:hypothetical protein